MQRTILLVEDDAEARGLISSVLTKYGYRVFEAADTSQAFELWTDLGHSFDLLISDVRLYEDDDGFMLAEKLLDRQPDVPVIFISGDRDCFASPAIQRFADAPFISKPFDVSMLITAVSKALASGPKSQA